MVDRALVKRGLAVMAQVWLVAALLIGTGYRLQRFFDEPGFDADAAIRYGPIALNLVAGNGFSSSRQAPYLPQSYELPGYPFFLAGLLSLSGGSLRFAMFVQLLLEIATVVGIGAIAARFSRAQRLPAIGLAAGCLFLPSLATAFLTETLAIALTTLLFAMLLYVARENSSLPAWGGAGAVAALAILTRVDAVLFVALGLPIALFLHARTRRHLAFAVFSACFLLTLAPWWLRDYLVLGRMTPPGLAQFSYSHMGAGYRAWMDTWADRGSDLELYVWGDRTVFPPDRLPNPDERARASALRARSLEENVFPFSAEVDEGFSQLARQASAERPLFARVGAGLKRALDSTRRVPSMTKPSGVVTPARVFGYAHWFCLLGVAIWGAFTRLPRSALWLSLALMAARIAIPFASAWGLETRYLYQAIPAVVLLGCFGLSRFGAGLPTRTSAEEFPGVDPSTVRP